MSILSVSLNEVRYSEEEKGIENVYFDIYEGELVGLIGENGAGKSTTIKAILSLIENIQGSVTFKEGIRYAYIPERPIYYDEMTLWEHLELCAASFELEGWEEKAETLLKRFRIEDAKHDFPSTFSKGMQQKLMLLLGFLPHPDLYIIDEPFIGLDPRATKEFITYLEEEKNRGATILMCTHVLDTAEKMCNRFLMMSNGTLLANGTLSEIKEEHKLISESLLHCFDELLEKRI